MNTRVNMESTTAGKAKWSAPRLEVLGKLQDVRGGIPVPVQNVNNS